MGIHPSVQLEGESGFEVFISPFGESRIKIFGNFIVGGERLENAEMIVDATGVYVNGRFLTSGYAFEMQGELRGDGYLLAGSAQLADPIEVNAQASVAAFNAVLAQREVVAVLRGSADAANATVSALIPVVTAAQSAVDVAQASVDSIQSSINFHSSKASSYYASYSSWKRKSCKWYDAGCKATRAAKMSYYYGKYAYHVSVRAGLYTSRTAANAVLGVARDKLTAARSGLESGQALAALAQAELDNGIAALQQAEDELAKYPSIDGALEMVVTIGIENDEVWAAVEGDWNGQHLTDGYVNLGDPGEACLVVPITGALCSSL